MSKKRWAVIASYRAQNLDDCNWTIGDFESVELNEDGELNVLKLKFYIDEIHELQEIVEKGPDFTAIDKIEIFYAM